MFAAAKSIPSLQPPTERFKQPHSVSKLLVAFPAKVDHLVPTMSEIPQEFLNPSNRFVQMAEEYFRTGGILQTGTGSVLKDKVNSSMMVEHMACVRGTFSLRQEHKIASLAFLFSCWTTFEKS